MGSTTSKPQQTFEVDEYGSLSLSEINTLPDLTSYTNLEHLSINSSNIDVFDLNKLPSDISIIDIRETTIKEFVGMYNKPVELKFYDMTQIPNMANNFTIGTMLYITDCDIPELDLNILPKGIDYLYIDKCSLEKLTGSFTDFKRLKMIYINRTKLTEIPDLPSMIKDINFNNNQLTSLPTLPSHLETITCNDNQLASLPELPSSLIELYCSNNQLTSLPELPEKLEKLSCDNNQITSLPKLPKSLWYLSISDNKLTKIPPLSKDIAVNLCKNDLDDVCVVDTVDSSNVSTAEYRGKEVKFITLKKGTVMFQSMKKLDSITLNFAGLRVDSGPKDGPQGSYVINPEHRTYFFLHPFNTGYGGITVIYVLQEDVKLILGINPSKIKGENNIYKEYGQRCSKKDYKSMIKAENYKPWCLSDDFLQQFPDVYGWMALGWDEGRKHYETGDIVKYGKYVSFYENNIGVIDRPEVAMYPFKNKKLEDVITSVSSVNYDFIVDNINKYNYEPIIVLEENKDVNSYKRIIDKLLSPNGCKGYKMNRSSKDGLYYIII